MHRSRIDAQVSYWCTGLVLMHRSRIDAQISYLFSYFSSSPFIFFVDRWNSRRIKRRIPRQKRLQKESVLGPGMPGATTAWNRPMQGAPPHHAWLHRRWLQEQSFWYYAAIMRHVQERAVRGPGCCVVGQWTTHQCTTHQWTTHQWTAHQWTTHWVPNTADLPIVLKVSQWLIF